MLAVAGGKGGVGKTTTILGLARAAARRGARPLVVDADRDAPDIATALGIDAEPGLRDFAEGTDATLTTRRVDGVDVLPARPGPPEADVRAALARLRGRDRPVLVDCPAGAGRAVALPLRAADRALLVTTPTRRSLTDAAKTAEMARALDTAVPGFVMTKSTGRLDPGSLLDCPCLGSVTAGVSPASAGRHTDAYDRLLVSNLVQNV